jgi:cytochrome bd-type quinol oxidase subunit 1
MIGGLPDEDGNVRYALHIPNALSFMIGRSAETVVTGLNDFPRDERPPVLITHIAFQIMVGVRLRADLRRRRGTGGRAGESGREPRAARAAAARLAAGLHRAAGRLDRDGGRPPAVGHLRRHADGDGVTPRGDVPATLFGFTVLYLVLGTALVAAAAGLARHRNGTDTPAKQWRRHVG